jgi:Holliday junction resolvasome RuvABC DNA-binding subunit
VGGAAPALSGPAESALAALERLGYAAPEAERALRQALTGDGSQADAETLVRRALHVLSAR